VPSPLTATAVEVNATVVQLFGPSRVKVMLQPAGLPAVVGLIAGVPGRFAVPLSAAVSVIGLPSNTSGPAVVANCGVTGVTVKHPLAPLSSASGTPVVADVKCADQQ
jgi:hypothetical protein